MDVDDGAELQNRGLGTDMNDFTTLVSLRWPTVEPELDSQIIDLLVGAFHADSAIVFRICWRGLRWWDPVAVLSDTPRGSALDGGLADPVLAQRLTRTLCDKSRERSCCSRSADGVGRVRWGRHRLHSATVWSYVAGSVSSDAAVLSGSPASNISSSGFPSMSSGR